jgi:hypothetical protein
MDASARATEYLYHHVVLPPKLPQKDDNDAAHERSLFEMVIQALEYLLVIVDESYIDTVASAIAMIKNLRDNRDGYGDVSQVQLEILLSSLTADEAHNPVPLEIKAQNACILISRQIGYVNFEFFELAPTNEAALRTTRLKRTFPGYASRIAVEQFMDKSLQNSIACTITKMATQSAPGFQPQARKNGKDEDEYRDTTAPGLVTDFLMTIIAVLGEATDVERITKATREDVLWNCCKQPWRRSPLWLLIRVVLHLWFTRNSTNLQSTDGLYKAFMICMLSRLLDTVCVSTIFKAQYRTFGIVLILCNLQARTQWSILGIEIVHNISAKLVRRLRKFERLGQSECLLPSWRESIEKSCLNAYSVIHQHWQCSTQDTEIIIDTTVVKNIQPGNDLDMKLPALDAFLSETQNRQHNGSSSAFRPSSEFPSFPATRLPEKIDGPSDCKYFRLAALENWVDQHLQTWIPLNLENPATCAELRRLIQHYFANASAAYARSPISMSIMYLTLAELWIACDRSACNHYPLLCEYDPEIYIAEFQCLVLPLKHDMERLHEVERYVQSRREAATSNLPSIYRSFGHSSSFAVRFFDGSQELQTTLEEIEFDASKKRERKCQELRQLKTKHDNLMDQYNSTSCDIETYVHNRRHRYTRTRHPNWCFHCSYERQANALSIHIYEWPVSSNASVAKATVFELKVPQTFSDWRDTSTYMASEVLCHRDLNAEKPSCSYTLDVHQDLSQMLSSLYHQRRIVPCSSVKPYNVTHRKSKPGIPHLTEDDVCLKNALQYAYFDISLGVFTTETPRCTEDIPKLCMYHVPQRSKTLDCFMYHPPSVPDGTTANEVIVSLLSSFSYLLLTLRTPCALSHI